MVTRIGSIHAATKLGHLSLTVSNLARALGFYKGILGLSALRQEDGVVALGIDDQGPLVVLTERENALPRPPHTTGLYHYALLVPTRLHLGRILRRLVDGRYPLQGAADHVVSEAIYLADPDGNGIEIYADRSRHEWPWKNDRLQMGTDVLDVDDLLSQGADDADGLPAGTRIGHVHLHVADLDQASRFYCDVLGFDLMQRFGRGALFLSAGGYHHHIGLNTWSGAGAPSPPLDAVGLRYFTIALPGEKELARVTSRIRAAGVPFERQGDFIAVPDGLLIRDPSGNGILIDTA
jgi:catechol 2,3-dioxygenase